MNEIRDLLRRTSEGFELPSDLPDRARRRAQRRRSNRRVTSAVLAFVLTAAAVWGVYIAFRGSGGRIPAASCPRTWTTAQTPDLAGPGGFSSVSVVTPDDVWAVGPGEEATNETSVAGSRPLAAHWNGASWRGVPAPTPPNAKSSELVAVTALAPDDVWAVGDADTGTLNGNGRANVHVLIEHWDGSSWAIVPAPDLSKQSPENRLAGVAAVSPGDVWAVGFGSTGNLAVPLIEHWDGRDWTVVPTPDATGPEGGAVLYDVAVAGPDDVWAVGDARGGTLTEHWDGTGWSIVPSPSVGSFPDDSSILQGVAAAGPDDVWAVGDHYSSGGSSSGGSAVSVLPVQTLVEHWDGHDWSIVESLNVGDDASYLQAVTVYGTDDVWAVGGHRAAGDIRGSHGATLIEQWDGSDWGIVESPDRATNGNLLGAAAVPGGDIWVVGSNATSQDENGNLSGVTPIVDRGLCH